MTLPLPPNQQPREWQTRALVALRKRLADYRAVIANVCEHQKQRGVAA